MLAIVYGQSPTFKDTYERFSELYDQERYLEALPFAEEALRLGENKFGPEHPTTGALLSNLAVVYDNQGRYAEAEPLFRRSRSGAKSNPVTQGYRG